MTAKGTQLSMYKSALRCAMTYSLIAAVFESAGISSPGKSVPSGVARSSGKAYAVTTFDHVQPALFSGDLPTKRLSKREMARRRKEERRRLFETREPFQCGMVLPKRKPLIYVPLADGMWRETPSGRVISHEHLQKYLTRYKII
jgi:hypothetical protein